MFEPLGAIIRRRRTERNLTQERLAQLAGVSRRHLALLEKDRANVSLGVLTRVARALELTEVAVGELCVRAAPPDLETLVHAGDAVDRAKRAVLGAAEFVAELNEVGASIDSLIRRLVSSVGSTQPIRDAAKRLEELGTDALGDTLGEIAGSDRIRPPVARPKPAAARPALRKGRR